MSGTCLTVGVTLLLLVFAFELPNKSDTYLCLLLIYDFMGAAVPGPGGRAARPQRCAHTCAWLCIAGKIARAVNDNRKALLGTCGLRQQMLLSHLFKPAELLSFRAFRADFTPSQQSVLGAPALRGGDGARSQGHLVPCGPRCILGVAGLDLQPPVLHPMGSVERDEMLRMLTVSGGVCAAQSRGEAALQGSCGFLHETGLVPPKYLWERQQKLLEH